MKIKFFQKNSFNNMLKYLFIFLVIIVSSSCKKENVSSLPEYYITFNDGNINKTYTALTAVFKGLNGYKYYDAVTCSPEPGIDAGILADFDFKIFINIPLDSAGMISKLKTSQYQVMPFESNGSLYGDGFAAFPQSYGMLTGGVKYKNNNPIYTCDQSNNSSNSYNNIKSVKYLDRVFNNIYNAYAIRFLVEGEYKMNCVNQYSANDKKTITGKYKILVERYY